MNIQERKKIIENTKGKIFTVFFRKKDGSLREMNCRMGVKKYLRSGKPTPSTTSHIEKYVTVYDMKSKGYRTVNLETLEKFKCGSNVIKMGIKGEVV